MPKTIDINVHHVTRVEGHGNIVVRATDGVLEECKLEIVESPRFFESLIVGQNWKDIHLITCRICGICSVGHTTASCRATERAFGLELTAQDKLLRRLLFHGEMLESHFLHVLFLAAPDLLDVGSVFPLVQTHPDLVKAALRLKKLANAICTVVAGRHIHPIGAWPGGFKHFPSKAELLETKAEIEACIPIAVEVIDVVAGLVSKFPDFNRKTEYLALSSDDEYAFVDGKITSSEANSLDSDEDYLNFVHEKCVKHSTAKHSSNVFDDYRVGALARFNLNHDMLRPEAKAAAAKLGLQAPCHNPFHNNTAQLAECVHCMFDAVEIIDRLLEMGIVPRDPDVKPRAARSVGVADVPRGILFHDYTYNDDGFIEKANLVIPTGQNYAAIEADMRELVPQILDWDQDKIRLTLEMLVRAYDPCISCSVHMLDVQFV